MKKYIFWDFDGTVLNTNEIIVDSWNATAMKYLGHELDEDVILATFGETIRYTAGVFFPNADVEEAITYYRDYQDANCKGKVKVFDGVKELIEQLISEGCRMALVTSRTKRTTLAYLEDFDIGGLFDVVITCDDVGVHKPDPEPLLMAIRLFEEKEGHPIDKKDCIMIGDTKFDIGCGNNAGVDTVLAGWSHEIDQAVLTELGFKADFCTTKVEEIRDFL
ncbi:MAG: HAD family hydrolase [Mogibacterium sp.]|nr:HAD family hydrolase [Mogibacterium sp.]